MKDIRVDDLDRKSDERGWLIEVLGGKSLDASHEFGQIHVSVAYPGKVRGNHYHTRKLEWFNVPMGKGLLRLKDLKTGEEKDIIMGEGDLRTVHIPLGVIHAIKNIGETDMVLIVYANESFDPDDPDTFYEQILE
jgi:UDP-2-acetamido-2,6-beta-L-arabino-hexul-4-ose reductase